MLKDNKAFQCIAGYFKRLRYFHGMLLTEDDFQVEQDYFRKKDMLHNRLNGDGIVCGLTIEPGPDPENDECEPGSNITIKAGYAIDCEGRDIILCNDQVVCLEDIICQLKRQGKIPIATTSNVPKPPSSLSVKLKTDTKQLVRTVEHKKAQRTLLVNDDPNGTDSSTEVDKSIKLYIGLKYCEYEAEPKQQYAIESHGTCGCQDACDCESDNPHPQFTRHCEGYCVEIITEVACRKSTFNQEKETCIISSDPCDCISSCCESEQIVILGSVKISNDYGGIFKITKEKFDMSDKRHYALPHFHHWEEAKQNLMKRIYRQAKMVDVSVLTGMPIDSMECLVQDPFLSKLFYTETELKDEEDMLELLDKVKHASPYVPEGSCIKLITDGECVLFPIVTDEKDCIKIASKS